MAHIELTFLPPATISLRGTATPKRARSTLLPPAMYIPPAAQAHYVPISLPEKASKSASNVSSATANMRAKVTALAARRGAMGRGVRACLRALYRRAGFMVEATRAGRGGDVYVECGPAYVLATASVGPSIEKVTRYAVENRAWPALQSALQWEEVPLHEARSRGARMRKLHAGGRYGRHLFFSRDALAVAAQVAEDCFDEAAADAHEVVGVEPPWGGADVEAVVHLRRMPLPGARTVSARCPRGAAHRNGDRKPSLMLWMNRDGVSGGAMCPVCMENASTDASNEDQHFLTWRVMYLPDNRAVLCTPRKRAHLALAEMCARRAGAEAMGTAVSSDGKRYEEKSAELIAAKTAIEKWDGSEGKIMTENTNTSDELPVGGCVIVDPSEVGRLGRVPHMAYVTAMLKSGVDEEDARSRSVGTIARQSCPLQALMWSDRRARGPMAEERAAEVAWFARASLEPSESPADHELQDDWLPTRMLSISAMRPTAYRELAASNGRVVSVPAGWEPSAQAWVVYDLDDVDGLDAEGAVERAAQKMVAALRRDRELSGRCAVVQTGPHGLHAWAELRETRTTPREWFASSDTRAWYARLGARVLAAAHKAGASSGKVDRALCAAGRFARRPGWRILPNGDLFRSRVVTVAASRVRNRAPRIS